MQPPLLALPNNACHADTPGWSESVGCDRVQSAVTTHITMTMSLSYHDKTRPRHCGRHMFVISGTVTLNSKLL